MSPDALERVRQRARHEHGRLALESVLVACNEAKIDVLPVKGIVTARLYYGDVGERPIQDVDLRVRPRDLGAVARLGARCGWRLLSRSWPYGTLSFDVLGFLVEFESHVGPPGLCALPVDDMLRRALRTGAPSRLVQLQPELHDHALLQCVNVFKDKLIDAVPGAIRDLELTPVQPGWNVERFCSLASLHGATTIVWIVATWLADVFRASPWHAVRLRLGQLAPRPLYSALFFRAIRSPQPPRAWLRMLTRAGADRPTDQARAVLVMALALWGKMSWPEQMRRTHGATDWRTTLRTGT